MCKMKKGKKEWKKVGHQEKYPPILFVYLHFLGNQLWVASQTEATLWRTISLCSGLFTPKNLCAVFFLVFFFFQKKLGTRYANIIYMVIDKHDFLAFSQENPIRYPGRRVELVMSGPQQNVKEKKPLPVITKHKMEFCKC